ncbi:hypothetical protein MA03_05955 [Infirmifilum uzonense]|uniref:Transcription elongation factor n=1 Tax=Infirmifilum uzonense TaxID=1550241 RepID=A0A0F7FHT2_9CREN|nr:hypothetical protein [Infirmifilum uzonense]AKG38889.1 hypothetical protein MA03_05955 [Infirmifilum uzonense]
MGRRRKRSRPRLVPKRKLPTVFQCPACGATAVSVSVLKGKEKKVIVTCANCGLRGEYEYNQYLHPVDYFSRFLDDYEAGKLTVISKHEDENNAENEG